MNLFGFFSRKRPNPNGFGKQQIPQKNYSQTFILEPILTPSGLVDGPDHAPGPELMDINPHPLPDIHLPDLDSTHNDIGHPIAEDIAHPSTTSVVGDPPPVMDGNSHEISDRSVDITHPLAGDLPESAMPEAGGAISDQDITLIPFVHTIEPTSDHLISDGHPIEITSDHLVTDGHPIEATSDHLISDGHSIADGALMASNLAHPDIPFDSGMFTVGHTGEVGVDYLFDGGGYKGELAIFSLDGMEQFEPGSHEFIQEAASRALSDSVLGHLVISDRTEGAKFFGALGERDWNTGEYLGVKTFEMRPGDEFGFMLIPNSTVQKVFDNPAIEGAGRPLFSLTTANPNDAFHVGQIADVTGDGTTFVMEDLRVDTGSDRDYNDIIFQVRGATGKAVRLDDVIAEGKDWRNTDMGEALIAYAKPYITPDTADDGGVLTDEIVTETSVDEGEVFTEPTTDELTELEEVITNERIEPIDFVTDEPVQYEFSKENQPLIGIIDTGFSANNPDIDYSRISLGKDWIDGDDNPLLATGEGDEHGTHVLGIIGATQDNDIGIEGINDDAPIWVGRAVGSGKWAESLVEFVDVAKESSQPNAVINLSMDLTQIDAEGNITTRYEFTPVEMAALEYARQNNVLVAVAAGNDGGVMSALGQSPQQFDNIITVGAAEQIDSETSAWKGFDRADYSSYGNGLDIVADSGTLENPVLSTVENSVGGMNGTSVATAKVTGAISQVWAANPELSYRQVIDILKSTATDLKTDNPDLETGSGLLNMVAAIHLAQATKPEEYNPDLQVVPITWSGEGKVTPMERAVRYGYEMKVGDTLWGIAQRELGNGSRWTEITKDAAGNVPFTSQEATRLPVGQVVYIPGNDPNPQPQPQPSPEQIKQAALNNFLNIFGTSGSASWLNFLKEMFEKLYNNPNGTLNSQAPQQGTGTSSTPQPTITPTQNAATLAGKKIILDPGHGIDNNGYDPGAGGNGTTEAVENLNQANIVATHLRQLGAEVKVLNEPLSLAQIGQRAAGYDLFVSLHQNSFNGNAQGHEVYSHPNAPAKDAELAKAINSELDGIFPDSIIPNRGVKTADFSVLRNGPTNVPAVLVESLFIDAPGMSRANLEKAAHAVARGIEKFFTGQVTGSTPQSSNPNPEPNPSPTQSGVVNSNVGSLPLNFRADSYVGATIIGSLSKGTSLNILKSVTGGTYTTPTGSSRNDWYQVEVNGKQGYVAAYYVDVSNPSSGQTSDFHPEAFSGWVGPNIGVALRNSPKHSDKSGLAEPYKKTLNFDGWMYGESVIDIWTGKSDALWYRYWRDGKAYWVPSAYINGYPNSKPPIQPGGSSNPGNGSTSKPGYVDSSIGLNFRTSPSASASRISTLPNGTNLTILENVSGGAYYPGNRTDWYRVKVGDTVGYVAAYYVKEGSSNNGGGNSFSNPLAGSWYAIYPLNEFGTDRGSYGPHAGIDLSTGSSNPPIKAAKGGTVVMASYGWNDGYGNYIKINHGNGLETRYAHLSSINVSPGQQVSAGTYIGNVGTTGNSTGNHLHFEIRVNGVSQNPRNYITF